MKLKSDKMMEPVQVVGLGLSPEDLSPRLHQVVNQAQVLAGGKRLLDYFPDHPARRLVLTRDLPGWLDEVAVLAASYRVVVLASGDPGFYGAAKRLIERLGPDRLVIHPNVTAVQAAFARLKMPWDRIKTVSLHGRSKDSLWGALLYNDCLAVYTDPHHTPDYIARQMLERGLGGWKMHVLEDLGSPGERTGCYHLEEAAAQEFSPLNIIVLERQSPSQPWHLGLPEEALQHEAGLITKTEIRAVALAKLALRPDNILWDLGAGSGSLGLEAAWLLYQGRVLAVERKIERIALIEANRARFGVANLEVVHADLPDGLDLLPDPDRIFIGGGGQALPKIIAAGADRLARDGLIVVSVVRLDSLEKARRILSEAGFSTDITMIQISRSRSLGSDQFLKALNPVWLISGRRI